MPFTDQFTSIDAPIAQVWNKLNNFHDMSFAPDVITDIEKVGDISGSEIGAKRILNGIFHETLVEIDNENHCLKYSIDDGPAPVSKNDVSNYIGVVKLSTGNDGTLVEWTSSWESKEEDAVAFCQMIYVALLNQLKASFN